MSFRPASRLVPFRAGLAAACTLLLAGTAAALDCPSGSQAVDVMVENRSGAPVAVSLRQDRSQDAWATLQALDATQQGVAVCLQMVLSVASAEYRVEGGDGATLCHGTSMIAGGRTPLLAVAADGSCAMGTAP